MPLFEGAGLVASELVGQTNGVFTSSPTWTTSPYGNALHIAGTNSAQRVAVTSKPFQDGLTKITLELLIKPVADNCRSFDKRGATIRWNILINSVTNPQVRFLAGWNGGNAIFDTPIGSITSGAWTHLIIAYDFGSTANVPVIYKNAVSQTVTVTSAPTGTANTDGSNITVGNRLAADGGNDSDISHARIWNRLLSAQEASSLYADPFQIYQKKSWFLTAAQAVTNTGRFFHFFN